MGGNDQIDKNIAECLYTGIITDTGGLSYNSSNERIYQIVGDLMSKGIDKAKVHDEIYDNYNIIYVKSNCILNNKHSFKYYDNFLQSLKWNENINNLINSIPEISNYIGMHIRMEGGENYQNKSYEDPSNWTKNENDLLFKYREISHIDNFINQINNILHKKVNCNL